MEIKRNVAILGLIIVLCSFAITVSAKPPPGPTQPDLFDMVVELGNDMDTVQGDLDTIQSDLDDMAIDLDTIQTSIDGVSTELGMATGLFFASDASWENVVEAYVPGDLARFTVTVSYTQEELADEVQILISYDGAYWERLVTLDPETGGNGPFVGQTTWSSTVVAQKIRIDSYNDIGDLTGNKSAVVWALSAVGMSDSPDLVTSP